MLAATAVPLPIATDNHQAANVREVVKAGGARATLEQLKKLTGESPLYNLLAGRTDLADGSGSLVQLLNVA